VPSYCRKRSEGRSSLGDNALALWVAASARPRHRQLARALDSPQRPRGCLPQAGGRSAAKKRSAEVLQEQSKRGYIDPENIASAYAASDGQDKAFFWLEKAFAEKSDLLRIVKFPAMKSGLFSVSPCGLAQLVAASGLCPCTLIISNLTHPHPPRHRPSLLIADWQPRQLER
jgi:hypothetical protein